MYMKKILLFLISTVLISLNFWVSDSFACSCAYSLDETLETKLYRASWVFLWEVVGESVGYKKSYIDTRINKWRSEKSPIIHFEVDSSWKGVSQNKVQVFARKGEASCWYEFEIWKKYLVFVTWNETYSTGFCTGNKEESEINNDIKLLDEISKRKELEEISQFEEKVDYILVIRYHLQYILFYVRELGLLVVWIIMLILWFYTYKKYKKYKK